MPINSVFSLSCKISIFVLRLFCTEGTIYIIVVNFRDQPYTIDLTYFENATHHASVEVTNIQSPKSTGTVVHIDHLEVGGYESLVLRIVPDHNL